MARTLTAKEICERALRAIGAFPLSESAPDGEMMREALYWLDLIMAEVGGTGRLFHLVSEGLQFTITNGQSTYPLKSSMGEDYPLDGIQFPVAAWLVADGKRQELDIITRDTWQKISDPDKPGAPQQVYITRQATPTLHTYPTPAAGSQHNFRIQLDLQRYTPNVAPGGVSGQKPSGSMIHGFREAWQRFLIMRLSQDLASGPIFKLAEPSLARFEGQAAIARRALLAFENREHDTEDPVVRPYDGPRRRGSLPAGASVTTTTPDDTAPPLLDGDGFYITLE